jgi:hypothetical protein
MREGHVVLSEVTFMTDTFLPGTPTRRPGSAASDDVPGLAAAADISDAPRFLSAALTYTPELVFHVVHIPHPTIR